MIEPVRRAFGGALVMAGIVALLSVPAAGQGQTAAPRKPAAAGATRTAKSWTSPRTPWGDPDLQGNFTAKDEMNTPFERPDEFAGKRIADVSPQELAAAVADRQKNAVESAPFITGSRTDGIAIGVPIHWLDHLDANNSRPWFVIDPPDGKVPPQTQESQQRAAALAAARRGRSVADSYIDRSNWDRCIARGISASEMTPGGYGASYQILQTKDYVAIRYEMVHETRIIPIEGRGAARPHINSKLRTYYGDSTARWDGNTLVVDTTNYNDRVNYRGARENLHLSERFTRTAPNKIEYTATVEDSTTWARPWTFSVPLTEDDGQPIFEYACHEGNYGIRNILAGAREDQKRGIEPSNGPALPPGQEQIE